MDEPPSPFWARVAAYRAMGLDPLKWIAGCSVEVEREEVLYPALTLARDRLASLSVTVQPAGGPDVFELRDGHPVPERVTVKPGEVPGSPREGTRANPLRGSLVMRLPRKRGQFPQTFADDLVSRFSALPSGPLPGGMSLNAPLTVGSIHAVTTPHEAAEVAVFEFYRAGQGRARGHSAVASTTLQIADASLDPLAEGHAAVVVSAALAQLFMVGITKGIALAPLFDGPGRKATDALAANFAAVAEKQGLAVLERPPLGTGKLFVGATVVGHTLHSVPNRHQDVKRGMQVLVTRPLGDLAPLASYLSCLSDKDQAGKLDGAGLTLDELARARGLTLKALKTPAREAGEVIEAFSPPFQEPPDVKRHVGATFDIGVRGILALLDFARRWSLGVRLDALPLADRRVAAFATSAFLMDNATACAPGCFAIVGMPPLLDEVERALRARGLSPFRVAQVVSRGAPSLEISAEAASAVASKHLLRDLRVRASPAP